MKRKNWLWLGILVVGLVGLVIVLNQTVFAQKSAEGGSTGEPEPYMLMIPRWFLSSITLDGKEITLPSKEMTIQFAEGNQANGTGACNSFGATYHAEKGGSLSFEPIMSTMMACDQGMDQEAAYFKALSQVSQFAFDNGKLVLTSANGNTTLVFHKPPK